MENEKDKFANDYDADGARDANDMMDIVESQLLHSMNVLHNANVLLSRNLKQNSGNIDNEVLYEIRNNCRAFAELLKAADLIGMFDDSHYVNASDIVGHDAYDDYEEYYDEDDDSDVEDPDFEGSNDYSDLGPNVRRIKSDKP